MFYKMINLKRDAWYISDDCTVSGIVDYIVKTDQMRDAQIEAIKTYLFLKIACKNLPLSELFIRGEFNNLDLDEIELSATTRDYLAAHPAAAALLEYATLTNESNEQVSQKTAKAIKHQPDSIDYNSVFKKAFYDVSYSDYLYSLPMGAGKTYLMAAFIYLDLYFAVIEPDNKAFAHNFIIFAPSGLKSSVVPSLKTIQNFDPSWIIPEPSASTLKRLLKFEVLDQNKTANKSNKTKNPNVGKIANHQPFQDLIGLVAVTNAEKVILDRISERHGQIFFGEGSDDEKDRQANELRNLIGKLPNLAIYIDEVHHAATDDKKLRAVVNNWMLNKTVNSVVGFSGTPYLSSAEKLVIDASLTIANIEISNIVYYYPLISGIGNFLKRPVVRVSDNANSLEIVEDGIREFLDTYKDKAYNGLFAKLGIYCGTIEKLEEQIYPLAARIAEEYGLNSVETILKFHRGNKQYPQPVDSQLQYDTLDKSISKIRIILLVQIGKEGWDCRSLTGVILSQEGDCPTNMVLQTSCRCLRQVQKGVQETALIYLNQSNAETLNTQLKQQQHITIKELENANNTDFVKLLRYNRMAHLKLPNVDFYQLKINYKTLVIDENHDTGKEIKNAVTENSVKTSLFSDYDFVNMEYTNFNKIILERGTRPTNFNAWLYEIAKESFGFVTIQQLLNYSDILAVVFASITFEKDGIQYFSSNCRISIINENIRKAFCEKRSFESTEELIPESASLLKVNSFTTSVSTTRLQDYIPDQNTVRKIIDSDKGKLKIDTKTEQTIKLLEETEHYEMAQTLRAQNSAHPMKDRTFHYLPYKTDSSFERLFLDEVLKISVFIEKNLEVYYNGDRNLTEFRIKCFKTTGTRWNYIGMYTPDFLIVQRKDGKIHKVIIVETKGSIYAKEPTFMDKRFYMENEFKTKNNERYGYERFDYLYLVDTLSDNDRIMKVVQAIDSFFGG